MRYVVRNTLIYVDSNSPSSVARLSTNFSRVPAFTNRTRTVSHSRCEISSSESCNSSSYRFIQLTCIPLEDEKQHCTASWQFSLTGENACFHQFSNIYCYFKLFTNFTQSNFISMCLLPNSIIYLYYYYFLSWVLIYFHFLIFTNSILFHAFPYLLIPHIFVYASYLIFA